MEKNLGSNGGRRFAFGAVFALVLAGSVLLWPGSGRSAQHTAVQLPAFPLATSSTSAIFTSTMRSNQLRSNSRQSKPDARAILGQLPLIFEPNQGQADPQVKFLARGAGYSLFLDATGAMLAIPAGHSSARGERFVRMKLVGANAAAVTAGSDPLPGKSNYIFGNDPHKWHTGIPQFAGVHYQSVYRGIDLVFYGNQGRLEYDFRVAPGANPSQAELQFDGATKLEVSDGDLILTGKDEGGLRLQAPRIYQRDGDREKAVAGRFVLRAANRVGFEIGPYDRGRELIIDPVLDFSTYFGGSGTETSPSVAVNGNGNIYIVGTTQGSPANTFPPAPQTLIGPLSLTTSSPSHIFVAEISLSQPPSVVYETFIGGTGSDSSVGIAVDGSGDAFLVGNTTSTDFPAVGVFYQSSPETKTQCTGLPSCTSIFVSELSGASTTPGATLTYSSYVSGNGNDQASGMTIDLNNDVFITGTTTSNQAPPQLSTDTFPASQGAYQPTPKASLQFFVTKVNTEVPYPGSIAYSTYFGGSTPAPTTCGTAPCNVGGGIAVDGTGNIYFDGTTNFYNSGLGAYGNGQTEDFPILNAYQPCLDTPPPTVLSSANQCSPPATTPYPTDAFLAKINPNAAQTGAAQLLFSTYLGGSGEDSATAIAIDSGAANVYLTGSTNSPDFVLPTGSAAFQDCLNNPGVVVTTTASCPATTSNTDAYVARMGNPTLSTTNIPNFVPLNYFSYLGGSGNDSGLAIAVLDAANTTLSDAVVTGATSSTNFPATPFPIQSKLNGAQNAFFAQIDTTTTTGQTGVGSYVTYFGGNGVDRGTGIAVDPGLNSYFVGDTTSSVNFPTFNPIQSTLAPGATRNAFVVKLGTATDLCIACVAPVISPLGTVGAGNQVTTTFTVANEGPDPATFVTVTGTVTTGATFISGTASSGTCSPPVQNIVTCQILTLQSGSSSLVNFVVTPNNSGNYSVKATVTANNNTNTITSQSATFKASDYSVTITPSAQPVVAGQIAQYTVTVNPNGVFGANVSLACSALPSGAACNFSNSTIALNGASSGSAILNLTTTAQPVSTAGSAGWRRSLYALWVMVPGMVLLGLAAGGRIRGRSGKSRLLGLLMLSLFFALLLLQPACSSSTTPIPVSGTPSGVYPLTVTATSGSFSRSVPFQLTVTP